MCAPKNSVELYKILLFLSLEMLMKEIVFEEEEESLRVAIEMFIWKVEVIYKMVVMIVIILKGEFGNFRGGRWNFRNNRRGKDRNRQSFSNSCFKSGGGWYGLNLSYTFMIAECRWI